MRFTYHAYRTRTWQGQHLQPPEAEILFILFARMMVVSTAEIIEPIWPDPDKEPECAGNMVCQYVNQVRKKFGRELIETDTRRGYRLVV